MGLGTVHQRIGVRTGEPLGLGLGLVNPRVGARDV